MKTAELEQLKSKWEKEAEMLKESHKEMFNPYHPLTAEYKRLKKCISETDSLLEDTQLQTPQMNEEEVKTIGHFSDLIAIHLGHDVADQNRDNVMELAGSLFEIYQKQEEKLQQPMSAEDDEPMMEKIDDVLSDMKEGNINFYKASDRIRVIIHEYASLTPNKGLTAEIEPVNVDDCGICGRNIANDRVMFPCTVERNCYGDYHSGQFENSADVRHIEPLDLADFSLVEIKSGTPHCKKHGAMNKITPDGIWRCIAVSGYKKHKEGNSVSIKHRETVCRAGCAVSSPQEPQQQKGGQEG